ncbi:PREDICTED: testis-specific Y-encoded-like protein 2 [Chrysochloris asiatica]|uniref:Testis-specific Y-encoded-like protein 2 n=1 Tax=Chrysochloris asiatica TaxID=185453 RepID=A0A9B0X1W7_CHRAS|nr:PREDICTED: testis-specific Y-encoded-like protein 2 [Chrysochloris asiatica]
MDRPDEPPSKARRLNSPELPELSLPPPLSPPQQRPTLQEETEVAQVLADMRWGRVGPAQPPPPPYIVLEEGGIRVYFTLGARGPGWEPAIQSGSGELPPPTESLGALSVPQASGGSLEIGFQVPQPSGLAGEQAGETCSTGRRRRQRRRSQGLANPKRKEEAAIDVEELEEGEKKRRRRKVKKRSKRSNAERMENILQALENIQLDLEAVNIKAGKAFLRLKRKFIQMRRPFLENRDLIIRHIPGFWVNAFLNHPKIATLINQRDEDIFRYLTNLQVQDLRHVSMGYKMKLYFQTNPYFTNMVIVKEFQHNRTGQLVSHSTPIRWHRGQEPQDHSHRDRNTSHSFFNWFSNHSLPEANMIAEIIKNDLWVNPLRYYMLGKRGYRTNRKKQEKESNTKKKCEVMILEDTDDYQAVKDVISETSDTDTATDNETIYDIKVSDFLETTDNETADSEVVDISENLCGSLSSDHNESPDSETTSTNDTTDNSESTKDESPYYNNESPDDSTDSNSRNPIGDYDSMSNNSTSLGSCDSDTEDDIEGSDDGNEGDNEYSDNEDSDDDGDIDGYDENPDKDHDKNNYKDKVEDISEEEEEHSEEGELYPLLSSLFSEKGQDTGSEQEVEDSDDHEEDGGGDSDMEEAENAWIAVGN